MLQIIGSGFGRTGTVSLKGALEQLGYRPCYHMMEVFQNPAHVPAWKAAAAGERVWPGPLSGYAAAIDWPAAAFWRELLAEYPQAKVIHTERPEDEWYRSFANTIQQAMLADMPTNPPGWFAMVEKVIVEKSLGGDAADEAAVRKAYRENNAAVRDMVPADRLLVFAPSAGWGPLCEFLGVPVPAEPYPHRNTTKEFVENVERAKQGQASEIS